MDITEKQIAELKEKYGELFMITTEDGKSCILRRPTRKDLSYVSVIKDPIQMSATMLEQLWVVGDDEIKTDDSEFLAVTAKMDEVLKVKEATIKKL